MSVCVKCIRIKILPQDKLPALVMFEDSKSGLLGSHYCQGIQILIMFSSHFPPLRQATESPEYHDSDFYYL